MAKFHHSRLRGKDGFLQHFKQIQALARLPGDKHLVRRAGSRVSVFFRSGRLREECNNLKSVPSKLGETTAMIQIRIGVQARSINEKSGSACTLGRKAYGSFRC